MRAFKSRVSEFLKKDQSGSTTVEIVIIFPVILFFAIFVFLLALDFFWLLTSQKAVERGAREAITSLPVAEKLVENGQIITYSEKSGFDAGVACEPSGRCETIATYSCRGGTYLSTNSNTGCDAAIFNRIYTAVRDLAPNGILPSDVTVTYEDSLLGRGSESYIPLVTVELKQTRVLGAFRWIDSFFSVGDPIEHTVAVTLVGESLSN